MFSPARTPSAVVSRLNAEVGRYLRGAQAREIFLRTGIEPSPSTPEELIEIMSSEVARVSKVLKK